MSSQPFAPMHEPGPEPAGHQPASLHDLREETLRLVAGLPGPLRRVALRTPAGTIEVEWPEAVAGPPAASRGAETASVQAEPEVTDAIGAHVVVAPLVGTFYRAAEPDAEPFVEEGQQVRADDPVAIVEAMKLMNRIEAGVDGTVLRILVNNGEMVEFEQPLLHIQPSDADG